MWIGLHKCLVLLAHYNKLAICGAADHHRCIFIVIFTTVVTSLNRPQCGFSDFPSSHLLLDFESYEQWHMICEWNYLAYPFSLRPVMQKPAYTWHDTQRVWFCNMQSFQQLYNIKYPWINIANQPVYLLWPLFWWWLIAYKKYLRSKCIVHNV